MSKTILISVAISKIIEVEDNQSVYDYITDIGDDWEIENIAISKV